MGARAEAPNKVYTELFGLFGLWTNNHTQDTDYFLISTHSAADFAGPIADSPAAGFVPKRELSADAIRRIVESRGLGGPPRAGR